MAEIKFEPLTEWKGKPIADMSSDERLAVIQDLHAIIQLVAHFDKPFLDRLTNRTAVK